MPACVLDSAMALAWVLPGEGNATTSALLDEVADDGALVPALWPLEIANVLLMAERRQRITQAQRTRALTTLGALPIDFDTETAARAWARTADLAATYNLTVYDATYLELALRSGLKLATLDAALSRAGRMSGIEVFGIGTQYR